MNILEHKKITVNSTGQGCPARSGTVLDTFLQVRRTCSKYQIEIEKEMVLTVKMVGDSLLTV